DGTFAQGEVFKEDFQVVVGAKIAQNLGLKIGDEFFGTHGDSKESEHVHDNHAYTVAGILAPTDKVIDNLILCSVESVWGVHEEHNHDGHDHDHEEEGEHHHHEGEGHDHDHDHSDSREITAVLLKIKNKMAFVSWPRLIPQNSNLQLAAPAIVLNWLFTLFGFALYVLHYLSYGIKLITGISIILTLYDTLKIRNYEFAAWRIGRAGKAQL